MSDADWVIYFIVISHLRTRYVDDRKALERQLNKEMHPDRKLVFDPRSAHDMYVIGKMEFGL